MLVFETRIRPLCHASGLRFSLAWRRSGRVAEPVTVTTGRWARERQALAPAAGHPTSGAHGRAMWEPATLWAAQDACRRPSSNARRAASRRVAAPSLRSTAATWCSAVRGDTTRRSAISAFVRPSATRMRTSSCRLVRPAGFARDASRRPRGTRSPSSRIRTFTCRVSGSAPRSRAISIASPSASSSSRSESISARS